MCARTVRWLGLCLGLALAGTRCGGTAGTGGGAAAGGATPTSKSKSAAATAYVDPTYRPSATVLASLAIVPVSVTGSRGERLDQGFERAFANTAGLEIRGLPTVFRSRMNNDHNLAQVIGRITAETYSSQDLAAGVGLDRIFSPKELTDLRTTFNSCSLLLVPVTFETQGDDKRTVGRAQCRTYDLTTGRLVLQNHYDVTITEGGEPGDRRAVIDLILAIEADFEAKLLRAH